MGCFDVADVCKLVGTYALDMLFKQAGDYGLHQDDGLEVVQKVSGYQADWLRKLFVVFFFFCNWYLYRLRKHVMRFFADIGSRVTIQKKLKAVDFLDLTMSLSTAALPKAYWPTPMRPSAIEWPNNLKTIPAFASRRLSEIFSDLHMFIEASPAYDDALKKCRYSEGVYHTLLIPGKMTIWTLWRQIGWYKPPYNSYVPTKLAGDCARSLRSNFRKPSSCIKFSTAMHCPLHLHTHCHQITWSKSTLARSIRMVQQDEGTVRAGCNCRTKEFCAGREEILSLPPSSISWLVWLSSSTTAPGEMFLPLVRSQ